jgi:hypothetical protein
MALYKCTLGASNLNLKKSFAYVGSRHKHKVMNSLAKSETPANISSGKSTVAVEIFLRVSLSVSPPKGEKPVRKT